MDCPVCQIPMVIIEIENIELDYCAQCSGVWFDQGEIELLMEKIGLSPSEHPIVFDKLSGPISEAKRRCPLCHKLMDKTAFQNQTIVIDQCVENDGIWFDSGETAAAFKAFIEKAGEKKSAEKALAQFLGNALNSSHE